MVIADRAGRFNGEAKGLAIERVLLMTTSHQQIESPRETADRRFTLIDAMILIALIGCCFGVPQIFRELLPAHDDRNYYLPEYMDKLVSSWLFLASVTVINLSILRMRKDRSQMIHQHGLIACVMVTVTWGFNLVQFMAGRAIRQLMNGKPPDFDCLSLILVPIGFLQSRAGLIVLGAWITVRLAGSRRSATDWVDALGRVLGWIWIVWGLLGYNLESSKLLIQGFHRFF